MSSTLSRSDFVKITSSFAGLVVAAGAEGCAAATLDDVTDGSLKSSFEFAPSGFVRVHPDDTVTVYIPNSEMGQGVATGLPTIVADELDVPFSWVRVALAPAAPQYYYKGSRGMSTGGSQSTVRGWKPLRTAGATARAMLVQAAANEWSVDPSSCTTRGGTVYHDASGRHATYGSLVHAAAALPVPETVTLKTPDKFTLIGKVNVRTDVPSKVNGSAVYGMDVRLPGMLYASVERPPVFGATVTSFDASKAKAVPNVLDVVQISSGVAVIAKNTWAAFQGRKALAVQYDEGANAQLDSATLFATSEKLARDPSQGKVATKQGNVASAQGQTIEALYKGPFLAHAPMEPMNATAHVTADTAEVWAPTQAPTSSQAAVAQVTGFPREKCIVNVTYLGGGFGRRSQTDFVKDAVEVSKAIKAPVKVVWSREDDTQHDWYRPMSVNLIRSTVNHGAIVAMTHTVVSESIIRQFAPDRFNGIDDAQLSGVNDMPYDIPNQLMTFVDYEHGIPVWWWRTPGANWNVFVVESFVDELAHAAGKDPVDFRLAMLGKDQRTANTLRIVTQHANWGKAPGVHQGVALTWWNGSVGALVADVTMDGDMPRLKHVTCVVDCGRVINPDIVIAQTQSAINYGWSAALNGKITIKNGRVEQNNFNSNKVLHMVDAPLSIDVYPVESTLDPTGIGELGTPPIAPAVANAVFAATGKRVRSLPFSDSLGGSA